MDAEKSGIMWMGKAVEDLTHEEAIRAVKILIQQSARNHEQTQAAFATLADARKARAAAR